MSTKIKAALATALELTGTKLSNDAARAFLRRLEQEDESAVIAAIGRATDECKYRLTVADVLERMPGRATMDADAAWALAIESGLGDGDEHRTIVVPEAIAQAFPLDLYESGDKVGARMAFKAAYPDKRRERGDKMLVSLGRNVEGREHALRSACQLGIIPAKKVIHHLPHLADDPEIAQAAGLPAPSDEPVNVMSANVIPLPNLGADRI